MSGGITRLKQHLTHTKGDVTGCTKVTTEITKRVLASMHEKEKITKEKRRTIEILNTIDLSEDEDVDDQGMINGRKTKQSTLDKNNPIKQNLKMVAWKKIATWAYTVGLPFNAVRDDSFQEMIYAVGEYGRVSPRNPLITILKVDHGKTKQSTLDKNNPIKQNLKMVAWKKIATWAYTVGLEPLSEMAVRWGGCDDSFQE
ncbi:hypothetical protein Tco_0212060 [Tanacetum coccineum]